MAALLHEAAAEAASEAAGHDSGETGAVPTLTSYHGSKPGTE